MAFCYDAEIPRGKSLEETVWWILTDFFAKSLVIEPKSLESQLESLESQWKSLESQIPVVETSANERGNTDRSPREDGGANHYNIIQIKGRTACVGQPKMTVDGSVQYY